MSSAPRLGVEGFQWFQTLDFACPLRIGLGGVALTLDAVVQTSLDQFRLEICRASAQFMKLLSENVVSHLCSCSMDLWAGTLLSVRYAYMACTRDNQP